MFKRGGGYDTSEFVNIPLAEGTYITNCDIFVTEEMIASCLGDRALVEQSALLEGAKIDFALKNLFGEGKDYKGLKKDVKEIIKANDLDPDDYRSKGKGFMHICKRICQISEDLCGISLAANAGKNIGIALAGGPAPITIIGIIIGFVVNFIINRLCRYLWDTIEFKTIKNDAEDIISDLRSAARKTDDNKLADKFNKEADRLEESLRKYSKKSKKD